MSCWGTPISVSFVFFYWSGFPEKNHVTWFFSLHLGTLGNKKKWRERVRSRHLLCNLHLIPLLFAGWPTIIVGVLHLDNLCFALSRKQIYSFLPGWIGRSPLMEWVEKGYGSARHTFSYINIFSNSPPVLATSLSSLPEVTFSDPFLITPF